MDEVLDELRAQGLTFIYNNQRIPPDLRVNAEPAARRGAELAREILAAHGLALAQAAPRVFAVIADPLAERERAVDEDPKAPTPQPPAEVVVQSSRYTITTELSTSPVSITQDQVKDSPRLADETLRALQRLPGSAGNGFSSLTAVRGGEPNESAIVLDGLRLYEPFHLKNFLSPVSVLDARIIEGMQFYSGGFPAPYGDRMSAIVEATSVRPSTEHYSELGLNLFHASALTAHAFDEGRGRFLLSARRGNAGDLAQFSENDFGRPYYSDGFGRIDYQFSERTQGTLQTLISGDSITALTANGTQKTSARYRNVYLWATLQQQWSDSASSRLIASYTDLTNERRGNIDEPGRRFASVNDDRLFHVTGLKFDTSWNAERMVHRFGIEAQRLWGQYNYRLNLALEPDYPFPGSPGLNLTRAQAPRPDGYETAAYWDSRFQLGRRFTFQSGLRIDTQDYNNTAPKLNNRLYLSPRFAVLYRLDARTQLRASWGRYFQPQDVNELQVEDGVDTFAPAPHADHWIVSLDRELALGWDLRIELYRKRYESLRPRFENLFDPLVLFPEAEFDRVRIDAQAARAEGAEVFLKIPQRGSWSGWLGYTWSRVEDRIDGSEVPRSWDQRHAVSAGLTWSKGAWTATLAGTYHSGWPTTAIAIDGGLSGQPSLNLNERNRDRLALYSTVDARLTRTFALSHGALDVFAEVTNALSRRNPCCTRYSFSEASNGSMRISRDTDPWLPLVPSVGVLWRY